MEVNSLKGDNTGCNRHLHGTKVQARVLFVVLEILRFAQNDISSGYLCYRTLRVEVNSSKDLIVGQSGSGKMPIGS